jgi:hypothetical protein
MNTKKNAPSKTELEKLKAEIEKQTAEIEMLRSGDHDSGIDIAQSQIFGNVLVEPFPDVMEELRDESGALESKIQDLIAEALTGMNRHQKNSVGDIRLGLVNDVFRIAQDNHNFNPAGFNSEYFMHLIAQLDFIAQVVTNLNSALRLMRDINIVTGDAAYGMALLYYRNIQVLAERRIPGAEAVYRQLRTHFRNRRPSSTSAEPTDKQLLKDVKAIMHGRKDGKIVIEGEAPHMTKGKRVVVDDVHNKHHGAWKETEHGIICQHCGSENHGHHSFCYNCGKELV